jgi:hypothetical protein
VQGSGARRVLEGQYELILESRRRPELRPLVTSLYDTYRDATRRELARIGLADIPGLDHAVFATLDGLVLQELAEPDPARMQSALDALLTAGDSDRRQIRPLFAHLQVPCSERDSIQPVACWTSVSVVERTLGLAKEALQGDFPLGQISRERQPGQFAVDLVVLVDDEVAVRDGQRPVDAFGCQNVQPGQPVGRLAQFSS